MSLNIKQESTRPLVAVLLNMHGQQLATYEISGYENSINTTELVNGVYVLRIWDGVHVSTFKWVKKE